MELKDTDEISIDDYFNESINLWSLTGMHDEVVKVIGLCALNTKEGKLENKKSKEKVKKVESLEMVRL
jgi:hypothetical protein